MIVMLLVFLGGVLAILCHCALGVAVLVGVAAVALGFDSTVLTRLSLAGTSRWEQWLIDTIQPDAAGQRGGATMTMSGGSMARSNAMMRSGEPSGSLPVEGELPSLSGATAWLNSPGKPIRFRVQLDGAAPGPNHGADTDASGVGVIKDQRLYQLIRQSSDVGKHVFSIEFLDSDVQAYSFTFG